ncbi:MULTISPECIES: MASE1 domain-containing protein [unclassified Herbaspirillum]|uniref:MASE1 domain-containing protein n=1 Tax=unclassified Herbaspirillum TaxID=2624150 RepID=UPI00114D68DA|nr:MULTISPECIES: MASE1 domain-containing protein [unclassified Herbaspirillum]MBB5393155.1 integral membrane sensor domain MASE1 [Herbaspirillum sp. SJZ102]
MKPDNLVAPLAWAVVYFLFGFASHELNGAFIASGYIWLPAGITVGALLLTPTARWFPLLVLLVAAQVLLGWIEQRELWRMMLFSLDEIGVAAIVVWLVRRAPFPMEGLFFVRGLLIIGVGVSVVSGIFGAAWFQFTQGLSFWQTLRIWALSDLVGILIMTPVLAGWSQFRATRSGGIARTEFLLGLASFVAMVASAYLAFDSHIDRLVFDVEFSTTYVPLFFIALVTLLWGGRGGALSVVVLSLMAFVYNSLGRGPFVELVRLHSSNALLELQVYLAVASLLSLLISTLKTTREQLHDDVARWKNEVELSLSASRQLAYTLDPQQLVFTWSGDVEALLGLPATQLHTLDQVLRRVSPLDQARLRQRWLDGSDGEARADMQFRLQDGSALVLDSSRSLLDAEDRLALVAGVWRFSDQALQAQDMAPSRGA